MLSRSLKLITQITFRNYMKSRFVYQNKINFGRIVSVKNYSWRLNPTDYNDATNKPVNMDDDFINPDSEIDMENNSTFNNEQQSNKENKLKKSNIKNEWLGEKINKIYKKESHSNEKNDEKPTENPLDQMYENVAKDEDLSPKDNHINAKDTNNNFEKHQDTKNPTNKYNIGKDNLYGMSLMKNDNMKTSDGAEALKEENKQNTSELNNKKDDEQQFDDVYVSDAEFKIPKMKHEIDNDQVYDKVDKNRSQSHTTVTTDKNKNLSQSKTTDKDKIYDNNQNQNQQYDAIDHNKIYAKENDKSGHTEKHKEKILATNEDLDLTSRNFQSDMKKYKQDKILSGDDLLHPQTPFTNSDEYKNKNDDSLNRKGDAKNIKKQNKESDYSSLDEENNYDASHKENDNEHHDSKFHH